jgi:corrinoid protein of di/trimethylamine methyltransferase
MTAKLQDLVKAVVDGDRAESLTAVKGVIAEQIGPDKIIEALTAGMRQVGDQFANEEIFLPGLMYAGYAMKAVMAELEPELLRLSIELKKKGSVVIGTVEGDMHEIGKDIVTMLLQAQGFEVHDLGTNVNALNFVRKAEEVNADIIGASALMTTTMPNQKDIIEILKVKGIRDKYHVILGGAPVTQEWVDHCGADSWGENAGVTVKILEEVSELRR